MKKSAIYLLVTAAGIGIMLVTTAVVAYDARSDGSASHRTRVIEADMDYVASVDELVQRSTLIVYGVPVGTPEFAVKAETGIIGDYVQTVRVIDVVKGEAPSAIEVVRAGLDEEQALKGVDSVRSVVLGGRLPSGPIMLFLSPSPVTDAYTIVGHTQGTVSFGANEQSGAIEHQGFDELAGLSVEQLTARVKNS
jgi:hypothetical protein